VATSDNSCGSKSARKFFGFHSENTSHRAVFIMSRLADPDFVANRNKPGGADQPPELIDWLILSSR
jgi:hypothetical protein